MTPVPTEVIDAIERHDLARLAGLLAAGADPNVEDPRQASWVPLKLAVAEVADGGPAEAVVLLLRHGADVDGGRTPGGATPLIVAAMHGLAEVARLLLAAGADPAVRDEEGDTPLLQFEWHGDEGMARLLRLLGAELGPWD